VIVTRETAVRIVSMAAAHGAAGRPSKPSKDEEARSLIGVAGAKRLERSIASIEGVGVLTKSVLASLGLGSTSGVRLIDVKMPKQYAKERTTYVAELVASDPALLKGRGVGGTTVEVKRSAVLEVCRLVDTLVGKANADDLPAADCTADSASRSTTQFVVTQSEEERSFTVPTYGNDDVKRQKAVVASLYNKRLRAHYLPTVAQMKRIVYWYKVEGCLGLLARLGPR
jgi:hypothetical protein